MLQDSLTRLARRAADPQHDPRHAILDISSELLSLPTNGEDLPEVLRAEMQALLHEIERVQPAFPSRRATSPLFDREAMGQVGRDQAIRLVQRLRALAIAVERLSRSSQ